MGKWEQELAGPAQPQNRHGRENTISCPEHRTPCGLCRPRYYDQHPRTWLLCPVGGLQGLCTDGPQSTLRCFQIHRGLLSSRTRRPHWVISSWRGQTDFPAPSCPAVGAEPDPEPSRRVGCKWRELPCTWELVSPREPSVPNSLGVASTPPVR